MTVAASFAMPQVGVRGRRAATSSRLLLLGMSCLYAMAIGYAHNVYLSYDWGYVGFSYHAPGLLETLVGLALIGLPILTMPTVLDRPSALILFLLYVVVLVPAVVIMLALRYDSVSAYGAVLAAMSFVFLAAGSVTQRYPSNAVPGRAAGSGDEFLVGVFVAMWALSTIVLVANYSDIMTFAGVDEVYDQRFAVERSVTVLGYLRIYYGFVISPALVAIGVTHRRYAVGSLGILGCLLSYMIDAQKTIFVLPFLLVAAYFALTSRAVLARSLAAPTGILALVVWSVVLFRGTGIGGFLSQHLVFRTLAIPGLSVQQYYDLFRPAGYTWWSNITGISLIVPRPEAFASNPYWPVLGEIVGKQVYGVASAANANASPFAGEGVAAAGWVGVIVIGAVLTAWLKLLDHAAKGWNQAFAMLLVLPAGIALTNVHLSTMLVSFGGAMLTIMFLFYKPKLSPGLDNRAVA